MLPMQLEADSLHAHLRFLAATTELEHVSTADACTAVGCKHRPLTAAFALVTAGVSPHPLSLLVHDARWSRSAAAVPNDNQAVDVVVAADDASRRCTRFLTRRPSREEAGERRAVAGFRR